MISEPQLWGEPPMKGITVQPSGKLYRAILYYLNRKKTNPGGTRRDRNHENTKPFPRHNRCAARNTNRGACPPQAIDVSLARSTGGDGVDPEKTGAAWPGVSVKGGGTCSGRCTGELRAATPMRYYSFSLSHTQAKELFCASVNAALGSYK